MYKPYESSARNFTLCIGASWETQVLGNFHRKWLTCWYQLSEPEWNKPGQSISSTTTFHVYDIFVLFYNPLIILNQFLHLWDRISENSTQLHSEKACEPWKEKWRKRRIKIIVMKCMTFNSLTGSTFKWCAAGFWWLLRVFPFLSLFPDWI